MQLPSHLAVNYIVWLLVFGNTTDNLFPYLIASVAIDIDHVIPFHNDQKRPSGSDWRTRMHELYGMVALSVPVAILWFINKMFAQAIALALLLHYMIDFLVGESRPFYPYSQMKMQIFFKKSKRWRIILEIIIPITVLGYILIWQI